MSVLVRMELVELVVRMEHKNNWLKRCFKRFFFDKCQCSGGKCFVLHFQAAMPTKFRATSAAIFPFISVR